MFDENRRRREYLKSDEYSLLLMQSVLEAAAAEKESRRFFGLSGCGRCALLSATLPSCFSTKKEEVVTNPNFGTTCLLLAVEIVSVATVSIGGSLGVHG